MRKGLFYFQKKIQDTWHLGNYDVKQFWIQATKKMAERKDRARVLGLLFDDGLDLSDFDSNKDDDDQGFSYLGDELLYPEELAALSRAVSSTQDVGRSVGDGAFVTPDEENEYEKNELLGKYE